MNWAIKNTTVRTMATSADSMKTRMYSESALVAIASHIATSPPARPERIRAKKAGEEFPHRPFPFLDQHAHRIFDHALEGDQEFGAERTVDGAVIG